MMLSATQTSSAITSTLHLQDNIERKLNAITGKKDRMHKSVIHGIFGPNSWTSCNDVISFEEALAMITSGPLSDASAHFQIYFEHALVNVLCGNVAAGFNEWTNDNTKSISRFLLNIYPGN